MPSTTQFVLGIESSCDETAAAILRCDGAGKIEICSDIIHSQIDLHAEHGGVVPEIAARSHVAYADKVVRKALFEAGIRPHNLAAVAATCGPGLIGGVMVGMMTGKAIAQASSCPFFPINHLEGHALSPMISQAVDFPYLLLLVSGGHCQFINVKALGTYERLGTTLDDAVGEAFDKTARLLDLGFPGGPAVEALAKRGNPNAVTLPRPLLDRSGLDMSFAGLKTAVLRATQAQPLNDLRKANICASFQSAIRDVLVEKSDRALQVSRANCFVVAGGVAANAFLRQGLSEIAARANTRIVFPPLRYCTDNAVMIALAGVKRLLANRRSENGLLEKAKPRWPLDAVS